MTFLFKFSLLLFFILLVIGLVVLESLTNKYPSLKWIKFNFKSSKCYIFLACYVFLFIFSAFIMFLTFDDLNSNDLNLLRDIQVKYVSKFNDIELEKISGTDFLNKLSYYNVILKSETIDYDTYLDIKTDLNKTGLISKVNLYYSIDGNSNLLELNIVD